MEELREIEFTEGRSEEEIRAKSKTLPRRCVGAPGIIGDKSNSEIRAEKEEVSELLGRFILTLKSTARITGWCL